MNFSLNANTSFYTEFYDNFTLQGATTYIYVSRFQDNFTFVKCLWFKFFFSLFCFVLDHYAWLWRCKASKYFTLKKGFYQVSSFMQMAGCCQLTLFDQTNMTWNTPCHNNVVNATYYDTRQFAKLVKKFVLEVIWSHPPTQLWILSWNEQHCFGMVCWNILQLAFPHLFGMHIWEQGLGSRVLGVRASFRCNLQSTVAFCFRPCNIVSVEISVDLFLMWVTTNLASGVWNTDILSVATVCEVGMMQYTFPALGWVSWCQWSFILWDAGLSYYGNSMSG